MHEHEQEECLPSLGCWLLGAGDVPGRSKAMAVETTRLVLKLFLI
jgi:hypothetical protein